MSSETTRRPRRSFVLIGTAVVLVLIAGTVFYGLPSTSAAPPETSPRESAAVRLSSEAPDTLVIPAPTVTTMRLTGATAQPARSAQPLRLTGQLMLDPSRLVHVHTRFSGEVVEVGPSDRGKESPLRVGDSVHKGQLLAILWSREIGEKKSDLVDALSALALHESIYRHLKSIDNTGAVAQRSIEEMRRAYESDLILVERLRRTLRSWRLDETEIQEIETEAKRIHERASAGPEGAPNLAAPPADPRWAEIEIRAPLDGVILEKNLTVGDIMTTDDDLFKIADLSRLVVMANVYEEDLPTLSAMPADRRTWQVRLTAHAAAEPVTGRIETIGNVIDPNQHTAVAQGWIDNADRQFRVGQFIEAVVPIDGGEDEVEVPITSVIDDGASKFVFIAKTENLTVVQRRPVEIRRRTGRAAFLPNRTDGGVAAGERVLTRGVLELSSVLEELRPTEPR